MFLQKHNKYNCCGCGACEQVCSTGAITMSDDSEGFLYPEVDHHKCTSCGRCKKVCPLQNELLRMDAKTTFLLIDKNDERRRDASSGGAFELACREFLSDSDNFAIWGCTLDHNFKAVHTCVHTFGDIRKLKKSKYIQSNLRDAFPHIRQQLSTGATKVIFSGTPCQTAALRLFLQRGYDNLLLVDFVCHGVPSQKAFDRYLLEYEENAHEKVKRFVFRNKNDSEETLGIKVTLSSGKSRVEGPFDNTYMFGYLNGFLYRPSCFRCPYANTARVSDITIADYWGIEEYLNNPTVSYSQGASMLLLNTSKGKAVYQKIQARGDVYTCEIPISVALKNNQNLSHSAEKPLYRDKFYCLLRRYPFSEALRRSQYPSLYKRAYGYLKRKLIWRKNDGK